MSENACESFLKIANQFKLGELETESPHPLTVNLASDAQNDLPSAINILKQVDIEALGKLKPFLPEVAELGKAIDDTLTHGGKIFMCGCGATGRLSIALETFCRQSLVEEIYRDRFIGFMAGGDVALIKSIENFEDRPEYGSRQLMELEFTQNDLLIGITEGGETPFVIGATEAAANISKRKPWFLFCNPTKQLLTIVERSKSIIENPNVKTLSLRTGPMGLSGSTRMQASTVLMASVGWAIQSKGVITDLTRLYLEFSKFWADLDLGELAHVIRSESATYSNSDQTIYRTKAFGVTVLTDTTERSPTFSLPAFENECDTSRSTSWCYLSIKDTKNTKQAWTEVLQRPPRCLEWSDITQNTAINYLYGFYIDDSCEEKRRSRNQTSDQFQFDIEKTDTGFSLCFRENCWTCSASELTPFDLNIVLKLILNIHSTLVMGRMGRFESNLMTYVRASNYKLIDRTIRYARRLCELQGLFVPSYEDTARKLFQILPTLCAEDPIVLKIIEAFQNQSP